MRSMQTFPMIRAAISVCLLALACQAALKEATNAAAQETESVDWRLAKEHVGQRITVAGSVAASFSTNEGTFVRFSLADRESLILHITADLTDLALPRPLHVLLREQQVRASGVIEAPEAGSLRMVVASFRQLTCDSLLPFLPPETAPSSATAVPDAAMELEDVATVTAPPALPPEESMVARKDPIKGKGKRLLDGGIKKPQRVRQKEVNFVTVETPEGPVEVEYSQPPELTPLPNRNKLDLLGLGADVTATSKQIAWPGEGPEVAIIDGNPQTRWSSQYADNQSITIDLKRPLMVSGARLSWEIATPSHYQLKGSGDGLVWQTMHTWQEGTRGPRIDSADFAAAEVQYIRLYLKERATEYGFSLYEMELYGP